METKTKIFGMPVVSFGFAARGFIAIGWAARGIICIAQFGYGVIAITQFGFGVISVSQFGIGLITVAQGGIGLILAIGQGVLGFIANGLSAKGYYAMAGPGVWRRFPELFKQVTSQPLPLALWIVAWAALFAFLWVQRDKLTFKMSVKDLFRSRRKHRDERIRLKAVASMDDQTELYRIALSDPSDLVRRTAAARITDRDRLFNIALKTNSAECAAICIAALAEEKSLHEIACSAACPDARVAAAQKLSGINPSCLPDIACAEGNEYVAREIIGMIRDQSSLERIALHASVPMWLCSYAIHAMDNPGSGFLMAILRAGKDIPVCLAAISRITDTGLLSDIIRGDYHTSLKTAAVGRIEDKDMLRTLGGEDIPEAVRRAIERRLSAVRPVYYSIKAEITCPHCSQPVFINAPVKKVRCQSCLRETALTGPLWKAIAGAGRGITRYTSPLPLILEKNGSPPACRSCELPLETDELTAKNPKPITCPSCGESNAAAPVPGWLGWSKHADLVLCAEEEGRDGGSRDMKPVAVSCIKCGAPLEVTARTPRNATCGYCSTVQYLPDPLWLSLHPVTIKRAWYIRCGHRERENHERFMTSRSQ